MRLANKYDTRVKLFSKSEGDLRYSLRRKVIDVIYDTNKRLQSLGMARLPRIEVRIVKSADYAGMAYTGHVEGCKLMDSNPWRLWSNGITEEEVWQTFLEYVAEYQHDN